MKAMLFINDNVEYNTISAIPTVIRYVGCNLILIDLENSPNYDKIKWEHVRWEDSLVEDFVGKLSSHASKDLKTLYPFVDKFHIVDSGMKDAVDHAISVRAGMWIESTRQETSEVYDEGIYIISRDRFALALIDVIRQEMSTCKDDTEFVHCVSIDECFQHLLIYNRRSRNF